MDILKYFLLVVEIISCFLLVSVILIQKSKSYGAGMAFGAGVGESLFGAQAGNVLTRTTVILAIIFLINTTILAMLGAGGRRRSVADSIRVTTPVPSQPMQAVSPQAPVSSAETPATAPGSGVIEDVIKPVDIGTPLESADKSETDEESAE